MRKQNIMRQLRDIREKMSAEIAGMDLAELQAYLKAKGSLADVKPTTRSKRSPTTTPRKPTKIFDSVKMVREIRDAHYRRDHDPSFDPVELERITAKWTKLLEEELRSRKKE